MSKLYAGDAAISLPDGSTVQAVVDLSIEETGPLVQWEGTATPTDGGTLWNGGQEMCTIKIGDADAGYRVGDCMIIEPDEDGAPGSVTVRGSGEFAQVETDE